jgi:hypothetical protein
MRSQKQKAVIAVFLALGIAASASMDHWQRFVSSNHFSTVYPNTWFRIGASLDRLQLLSSRGGAEGVIIKRGQAQITVSEVQASAAKTLTQVINDYTQGASVLSRRDIPGNASSQGCSDLKEVISREQAIPATDSPTSVPYVINTDLFCQAEAHKIVILLRNWEGDNRQEEYQQIALRMAKGIRLVPGAPH